MLFKLIVAKMESCQFVITMMLLIIRGDTLSNAYPLVSTYSVLPEHRASAPFPPPANPRLSVVEWDQYSERDVQGPNTYAFGYDVQNPDTDDTHFRHEERLPNGTVVGSYGYVTPDGNAHVVKYIADHLGYRATVESTKRLADVKPIPVNVDQALADDLAEAELALHNENNTRAPIATYDNQRGKYITKTTQPKSAATRGAFVNNRKEYVYTVRNNLAQAALFKPGNKFYEH